MKNKIETIICDMDGTIADYPNEPFRSSWDALREVLSEEQRAEWTRLRDFYYPKRELLREWYKAQVALLRGIKVKDAEKHLFPVPYSPGVREFFYSRNGFLTGVVTSGVSLVADRIKKELGFDFSFSNMLTIRDGMFAGTGEEKVSLWDKHLELERIAKEYPFDLRNTLYIGDNENDIPAFNIVGLAVAFNPKNPQTERAAKYVIRDFRELNGIIGN